MTHYEIHNINAATHLRTRINQKYFAPDLFDYNFCIWSHDKFSNYLHGLKLSNNNQCFYCNEKANTLIQCIFTKFCNLLETSNYYYNE